MTRRSCCATAAGSGGPAARHANATTATVALDLNGHLEVQIDDDGDNVDPWVPGVGLTSMNERAAEIGGTVIAGPISKGGRVLAVLPVEP